MRNGVRTVALLLLMLAASAVQAQLWRGAGAVEVRVEERGNPVAGAELTLRFNGMEPKEGPAPVTTDSRGRANVSGLAPGSWQVEVSHNGFMTYLADIEVREGGRPELVQATQLRVAGATKTLDVKISKGRPAPEARAAAPRTESRPVVRETPPPPPAPAPRAEPAPAPRTEPTPPPRQPEAQPAPEPPKEQPVRLEPPPAPAPQPVPQPVPRATPPPQTVTPSPPPPQPAPQSPTPAPAPPTQTVQPTPPPVAAPSVDSLRTRTAKDRTCVECQPGESSLSLERVVAAGVEGGGCGTDLTTLLRGTLSNLPAGCDVLQINLPEGTRYIGYRFEVQDGSQSLDCPTGRDCPGGLGRWPADPIVIRGPQKTVVRAAYEGGPVARERRVVLTVYYTTPTTRR